MSEMSVKEAYRVLQANCGIEVGDTVKVLRTVEGGEMGFGQETRRKERDQVVGKHFQVTKIGSDNYGIVLDYNFHFPFFCLELVEKAKPELPPITVGKYEVKFFEGEIRVCDVKVSADKLRLILDRLKEQN